MTTSNYENLSWRDYRQATVMIAFSENEPTHAVSPPPHRVPISDCVRVSASPASSFQLPASI